LNNEENKEQLKKDLLKKILEKYNITDISDNSEALQEYNTLVKTITSL
jgi:hypothetical protein